MFVRVAASLLLLAMARATALGAALSDLGAAEGEWAFAAGQGAIAREVRLDASWAGRTALTFRAGLSEDTLHTVRLFVYLVGPDDLWYQSAHSVDLERRSPVAVSLDLGPDSDDWVPQGHLRPWDGAVARHVVAAGLKAFCDGEFEGSVLIGGVALRGNGRARDERLRLLDFQAPATARVGQRYEIRFRLSQVFDNPFDAAEVDVHAFFMTPGGEAGQRAVPGFFTQRYFRRWEGGGERLVPAGPAEWRIRFWPDRPGPLQCHIRVRTRDAEARVPWSFEVEPAPQDNGAAASASGRVEELPGAAPDFVVSREYNGRDPIYVFRPPQWRLDGRTPPPGPMRAWRAPIEWTERWGGYGGLGRMNLAAASTLDDLLDEAASRGVALPLAFTCDEPFGDRAKFNWQDNPLNQANGGPLEAPSAFFTNPVAWDAFMRVARYVVARWGGHPAVASWELWCTVPANGADPWHAQAGGFLAAWALPNKDVRSLHPQTLPPATPTLVNTFRREEMASRDRWVAHTVIKNTTESVKISTARATEGKDALEVVASYPGEAAILRTVEQDWSTYDQLVFDVFVPRDAPNDMRVMVYLRDGDLWWYESLLPAYLRPGDWTKLLIDLSGETTPWQPQGHEKVFDRYALQRVRVLGIRVFGHRPYHGPLYIDNIQLWRDPVSRQGPIKVTALQPNTVNVPRHGRFELSFELSKTFANPFDPDCVDLVGHFVSPGGRKQDVPAFFYQDYERHLADGREILTPKGRSTWKIRFTPDEVGSYTYTVTLNKQPLAAIADQHFDCIPSDLPGFVRRSKADPHYFELTTGQFFYPIGMNLRSPSDNRKPYPFDFALPEGKGTYIYDDYYRKLAESGMNWARIWQCPWWCGLEWTRQWPGYQGLGRYNQENAWRFDYCLDQAAQRGIYIQACLTNHGQITVETDIDRQWDTNPLNAELGEGGSLKRAADFYTDERARKLFRQRLRYIVARWGYNPHLMAFALFSEMEFTEAYWRDAGGKEDNEGTVRCPVVADWVGEMARYLKSIDPFGHLVTTHFSHPWRGFDVWSRPELDLVQSNAYSAFQQLEESGVDRAIEVYYDRYMGRYGRPVLIAEYGGHWMRNPAPRLNAELHAGTWASVTSPLAGATGFWWWLHVHFTDQYRHYRAAANYMAGEDRRGQDLRQAYLRAPAPGTFLRARALKSDKVAYVWVYNPLVAQSLDNVPPVDGAHLDLQDMAPGRYTVEVWDTYAGKPTATLQLEAKGQTLRIDLPTVRGDLALKVKPAK